MSNTTESKTVEASLGNWPAEAGDITTDPPRLYDMRTNESYAPLGINPVARTINDARALKDTPEIGRHGFALYEQPSAVEDWFETVVLGYGADNYSWHEIGIETYNVKASDRHGWYYYPLMTNRKVLIFKSYDSDAVIGNTCPHASFTNPAASPDSHPRMSIELRVLCFVTS
jgi:hypothetical protein